MSAKYASTSASMGSGGLSVKGSPTALGSTSESRQRVNVKFQSRCDYALYRRGLSIDLWLCGMRECRHRAATQLAKSSVPGFNFPIDE
jgi:hypothetical protein